MSVSIKRFLVLCCVLAMWNRYERWFDLDIQPWQEGWRGSGGRLRGVTPSVRTHSSKSLPFLLCTHTCAHAHTRSCNTHTVKTQMHMLFQEICSRSLFTFSFLSHTHTHTHLFYVFQYHILLLSMLPSFLIFKWFRSSKEKHRGSLASVSPLRGAGGTLWVIPLWAYRSW